MAEGNAPDAVGGGGGSGPGGGLAVVCVGGGAGSRFGGDKLAELIGARTVFETAILQLRTALPSAPVVAVVPAGLVGGWRRRMAATVPDVTVVAGGERRQDSVRNGVDAVAETAVELAVIHDAARPLVDPDDVRRVVGAVGGFAAAVLCRPMTDTVKLVEADGRVVRTLDRRVLRRAQTPQVVRLEALRSAWRRQDPDTEWTDEASLLESSGWPVTTVLARRPNPKVTLPDDLTTVRALWGARG